MASPRRRYWIHCEWASYAIPIALGLEPGADAVLAEANQLVMRFTEAGYEPIETLAIGPPTALVLPDAGQLTVQRTLILWGLRDYREPSVQAEFLEVAREVQEARRVALIESERHRASESARKEISDKLASVKADAGVLEHIQRELDKSK